MYYIYLIVVSSHGDQIVVKKNYTIGFASLSS